MVPKELAIQRSGPTIVLGPNDGRWRRAAGTPSNQYRNGATASYRRSCWFLPGWTRLDMKTSLSLRSYRSRTGNLPTSYGFLGHCPGALHRRCARVEALVVVSASSTPPHRPATRRDREQPELARAMLLEQLLNRRPPSGILFRIPKQEHQVKVES